MVWGEQECRRRVTVGTSECGERMSAAWEVGEGVGKGEPASVRSGSRRPGGSPWPRWMAVVSPGAPSSGVLSRSVLSLGSWVQG